MRNGTRTTEGAMLEMARVISDGILTVMHVVLLGLAFHRLARREPMSATEQAAVVFYCVLAVAALVLLVLEATAP